MKAITKATAATVLLALTIPAQASLLIGNLPLATQLTTFGGFDSTTRRAVGFTVGSTAQTLTDLSFEINATGTPFVQLYSGATPSVLVDTLIVGGNNGAGWTAAPSTSYALAVSTTYWVVVGAAGAVTGTWYYNTAGADAYSTPGSFASYTGTRVDSGSGWGIGGANQYAGLNVNAVPEPHQYAMLAGLGLIGFAALRRKFSV